MDSVHQWSKSRFQYQYPDSARSSEHTYSNKHLPTRPESRSPVRWTHIPFGLCRRYHKHTAHFPENSPTEERKEKIDKVQMISLTQRVSSTAFSRLSPPGWFQQTPPFLCKILNYIGSHCGICPYPHFEPMFDGLHGEVLLGEDLLCIFSVRIVCFKEWLLKSSDYWAARVPQCSHCWWGWGRWRAP